MFTCRIDDELELRLWGHSHAEKLFAVTESNRAHLRRWLPWVDITKQVDDTRQFIRRSLEQFARNDGFHCGIFSDDRIVGGIGLVYIRWSSRSTEIGYWLAEEAQGQGIITRTCRRMMQYLFEDSKLNRVEIRCASENNRSRAVPQRLGFREEGTLRQIHVLHDRYIDLVVYSMLCDEWRDAPR